MQENHLNNALKASREMIRAYFVKRSVDSLIKYLDSEQFTFFFITEDYFYNSTEEFLKYAVHAMKYWRYYELIDDNYSVEAESQDSCLIVAKIALQDTRNQKVTLYKYIFYFKQQGDNVICTHNHVMLLYTLNPLLQSEFFDDSRPDKRLFVEILSEYEDLAKVSNSFSLDIGIHLKHNVVIYPHSHKIKINDEIISFTKFESEIFLVLIDNMNQPIAADEIYKKIYENSSLTIKSNALAVHISNIRRKLSSYEDLIQISYVKDEGYCLQRPPKTSKNNLLICAFTLSACLFVFQSTRLNYYRLKRREIHEKFDSLS